MSHDDREVSLEDEVNPDYRSGCTVCTGDKANNIWYIDGQCRLDQLTYDQVVLVLKRVPGAADHLRRITSDPYLLKLADEVTTYAQDEAEEESVHKRINGGAPPFYTVLRGNTDGTVR